MATIKDLTITFPLGDRDLTDIDGICRSIIERVNDGDFPGCIRSLDAQVTYAANGPAPRAEGTLSCTAGSQGWSCTGGVKFGL